MSCWTYISGIIEVDVPGRTQPEIEHILKTIIDHLPIVTGSDKREYIINEEGYKNPYDEMYEMPSWCNKSGEPSWWEHLMWKRFNDWPLPINHIVKYYQCEEADKEFEKINNKVLN